MTRSPDRRSFIGAALAAATATSGAATPATGTTRARAMGRPWDFSRPADNVEAFVRVRGDTSGALAYTYTSGRVYGQRPGETAVPLMGYESGLVDRYERVAEGTFRQTRRELMHFTDLASGALLARLRIPYTGRDARPMHALVGPLQFALTPRGIAFNTHDPAAAPGQPFLLDWRVQGDELTLTQETIRRYANSIRPQEFPFASNGDERLYCDFLTYRARRDELEDRARASVFAHVFYSAQTNFQPWMMMGQDPGHLLFHASGFKTTRLDALPRTYREITESLHPGLLADPFGFPAPAGRYEMELREREAEHVAQARSATPPAP